MTQGVKLVLRGQIVQGEITVRGSQLAATLPGQRVTYIHIYIVFEPVSNNLSWTPPIPCSLKLSTSSRYLIGDLFLIVLYTHN